MEAISEATKLWADSDRCKAMITMWQDSEEKTVHEVLVRDWVGTDFLGSVVDIGCGAGRLAGVLSYGTYIGYDQSLEMLGMAMQDHPSLQFTLVDIFNFQDDEFYDTLVMLDVAQHQKDPIGAVLRVLDIWKVGRCIISLLVGPEREELSYSTVAGFLEFIELVTLHKPSRIHMERLGGEGFAWVLLEISNGKLK
jgi:trans-aconitate methyltransferase